MSRPGEISVREIATKLNGHVAKLAPDLLKGGRTDRHGKYFEAGSIGGEEGQSLKLNLKGPNQGLWVDFAAPEKSPEYSGDLLGMVSIVRFGGDLGRAVQWAKSYLGLDNLDPDRLKQVRRETAEMQERNAAEAEKAKAETQQRAEWLWQGSVEIRRTPAEGYLRGRGIDFARLGRIPGSLRYRPDVWCPERRGKFPAMVACIMGLDGTLLGVHRTYLDLSRWNHATREGPVSKARVKNPKRSLGLYQGGCIPLWKGDCRRTLREIDAATPVYLSEGIEDGLTIACAHPSRRVVAGVALSNMGGIALPPQVGPVVLVGQNDPMGSKAADAFERVVQRLQEAGRSVQLIFPPEGFKDFNDQLLGKRMGVAA